MAQRAELTGRVTDGGDAQGLGNSRSRQRRKGAAITSPIESEPDRRIPPRVVIDQGSQRSSGGCAGQCRGAGRGSSSDGNR